MSKAPFPAEGKRGGGETPQQYAETHIPQTKAERIAEINSRVFERNPQEFFWDGRSSENIDRAIQSMWRDEERARIERWKSNDPKDLKPNDFMVGEPELAYVTRLLDEVTQAISKLRTRLGEDELSFAEIQQVKREIDLTRARIEIVVGNFSPRVRALIDSTLFTLVPVGTFLTSFGISGGMMLEDLHDSGAGIDIYIMVGLMAVLFSSIMTLVTTLAVYKVEELVNSGQEYEQVKKLKPRLDDLIIEIDKMKQKHFAKLGLTKEEVLKQAKF